MLRTLASFHDTDDGGFAEMAPHPLERHVRWRSARDRTSARDTPTPRLQLPSVQAVQIVVGFERRVA